MDYDSLLKQIEDRYNRLRAIFEITRSPEAEELIVAYRALQAAKAIYDDMKPEFQ